MTAPGWTFKSVYSSSTRLGTSTSTIVLWHELSAADSAAGTAVPLFSSDCCPTVFQRLCRVATATCPSTHLTVYLCHQVRITETPDTREDPGEYTAEDYNYEDYADSSMYAMRVVHSANVRRPEPPAGSVTRPRRSNSTIVCVVTINGHEALALFDSGSTTDSITPEFGFVTRRTSHAPARLRGQSVEDQLRCRGARGHCGHQG